MKSIKQIIDRILAEHETILRNSQNVLNTSNDAGIVTGLTGVESSLAPANTDTVQMLGLLQGLLESLTMRLNAHFTFEEAGLVFALEKYGDRQLSEAFGVLFLEHENLRNGMARAGKEAAELAAGDDSPEVLGVKIQALRDRINNIVHLLRNHAAAEQKLLEDLRDRPEK